MTIKLAVMSADILYMVPEAGKTGKIMGSLWLFLICNLHSSVMRMGGIVTA